MSKTYVIESELSGLDFTKYHEFLLTKSEQDPSAVLVFAWPRMATFVSANTPAPLTATNQLIVLVENPDDPETATRIKALIAPGR